MSRHSSLIFYQREIMFALPVITEIRARVASITNHLIGNGQTVIAKNNRDVDLLETTLRDIGSFPETGSLRIWRAGEYLHLIAQLEQGGPEYDVATVRFVNHPNECTVINTIALSLMFLFPNKKDLKFTIAGNALGGRLLNPAHVRLIRYFHRKGFYTKNIISNSIDSIFIGGNAVANAGGLKEVISHTSFQIDRCSPMVEQTVGCVFPDRTNWRDACDARELQKSYWCISRATSSTIVDTIDHLKALPNRNSKCDYLQTVAA